jgi:hypothetical protein
MHNPSYVPNASSADRILYKVKFLSHLRQKMLALRARGFSVLLVGDLNMNCRVEDRSIQWAGVDVDVLQDRFRGGLSFANHASELGIPPTCVYNGHKESDRHTRRVFEVLEEIHTHFPNVQSMLKATLEVRERKVKSSREGHKTRFKATVVGTCQVCVNAHIYTYMYVCA